MSSMPRPRLSLAALAVASLSLGGCWTQQARWQADEVQRASVVRPGESEAERLYRHGRDCMDVVERDECAIDYFEQLVELSTKSAMAEPRRDLVGDAIFRLVELYRRDDQQERATLLLREFWDVGMDFGSAGVVPYGSRFVPESVTSMFMVDVTRLEASRLHADLPADAKDMMFTCDEARREQLSEAAKARREERRAAKLAAMSEEEREAYEKAKARREQRFSRGNDDGDEDEAPSIYDEGFCQLAAALDVTDLRGFSAFLGARHHEDATQSVAVLRVDELEAKLAASTEAGRLILEPTPEIPGRDPAAMTSIMRDKLRLWTLAGAEYEGAKVQIVSFDRNELILAPEALVPGLLHARAHGQDRVSEEMRELLMQVPADVAFMTVVAPSAMEDMMGSLGAMAKLLPDPEGMMMAAVVYDYAGFFIRVPTDDSVKGWLVLSLARRMLDGGMVDEDDPFTSNLDMFQAPDGKALLMSNILTRGTVLRMFLG